MTLKSTPDEHIELALQACLDTFAWPPELPEFKKLCESFGKQENVKPQIPWADEVLKFDEPKNNTVSDGEINMIIKNGTEVCKKIKNIYPEKTWMQIASVFTRVKVKVRTYYPGIGDSELLNKLKDYTDQDIMEVLACG